MKEHKLISFINHTERQLCTPSYVVEQVDVSEKILVDKNIKNEVEINIRSIPKYLYIIRGFIFMDKIEFIVKMEVYLHLKRNFFLTFDGSVSRNLSYARNAAYYMLENEKKESGSNDYTTIPEVMSSLMLTHLTFDEVVQIIRKGLSNFRIENFKVEDIKKEYLNHNIKTDEELWKSCIR